MRLPQSVRAIASCLGNFSDLLVVFFGEMEMQVDPYTSKKTATTELQVSLFCDVAPIRNSFVISTDSGAQ